MFFLKKFWRKRKKIFGLRFTCETLIWIVCVLGLTILTIHQILPLFAKFLTDPPDTSVEIFRNKTLILPPAAFVCLAIGHPPTFISDVGGQFKPPRFSESQLNFWAEFLVEDSELDEKCSEFPDGKSISEVCGNLGSKLQTKLKDECNNISTTSSIDKKFIGATGPTVWSKEENCSAILFAYHRLDTLCVQPMRIESRNKKIKHIVLSRWGFMVWILYDVQPMRIESRKKKIKHIVLSRWGFMVWILYAFGQCESKVEKRKISTFSEVGEVLWLGYFMRSAFANRK